jgi:hypothetical protein
MSERTIRCVGRQIVRKRTKIDIERTNLRRTREIVRSGTKPAPRARSRAPFWAGVVAQWRSPGGFSAASVAAGG